MKGKTLDNIVTKTIRSMSTFARSTVSKYKFGAHMSGAGGISNSVTNAFNAGCNSFAMFLKSPRKWVSPAFTQEEIAKFKENCEKYGYNPLTDILPHGQYFINLANPDPEKAEKSYESFIDDLTRCEQLGVGLYNFHPGSTLKGDHDEQLKQLASYINKALGETKFVKIVLENMAGTGNLVGSDLTDLRKVIDMVTDKSRIGVCIDTCHTFAAGYDIQSKDAFDKFWKDFDDIIGYKYLASVHLNDSKAPLGANRDLHEKLGEGYLGLDFFRNLAHYDHLKGIPIVLETPQPDDAGYAKEVKLLEWLETIEDGDTEKLKEMEAKNEELQKLGEKSRKEQMSKFEKKKTTTTKKRKATGAADITAQLKKAKK